MVIALTPQDQRVWVAPEERGLPEDQQTKWVIRPLTARKEHILLSETYQPGRNDGQLGTMIYLAVALGLADVVRFKDEEGNLVPIAFEPGPGGQVVADSFLSRIPKHIFRLLADEILKGTILDAETRKN